MLMMNVRKRSYQLLVGVLLCGLPTTGLAKGPRRAVAPVERQTSEATSRQPIGAPQVLEIAPMQDAVAEPPPDSSTESSSRTPPQASTELLDPPPGASALQERGMPPDAGAGALDSAMQQTYLGVLYATAEDGPVGVKVLDVIPGSPAAQAGFEGVNTPRSQSSDVVRTALIILAMSPVGPFAMPLVIAHDMYMASQSPGDLIVAIGEHKVRDASEFNQEMRRYRPGDSVTFSVLRRGKPMQISVQLEAEPS